MLSFFCSFSHTCVDREVPPFVLSRRLALHGFLSLFGSRPSHRRHSPPRDTSSARTKCNAHCQRCVQRIKAFSEWTNPEFNDPVRHLAHPLRLALFLPPLPLHLAKLAVLGCLGCDGHALDEHHARGEQHERHFLRGRQGADRPEQERLAVPAIARPRKKEVRF